MTNIVFAPYYGALYSKSPVRLLIVGESHYGEFDSNDDTYEATRNVVRMWQSRDWAVRFLTIAARILSGQRAWEIDRQTVFSEIAFYNFVQFPMPTVHHRPTQAQARASWAAFREVLETYDPTHILVTGTGFLWSNMPPSDWNSDEITFADVSIRRREYRTRSGRAAAIVIPHLSRASASCWQAPVWEFLGRKPDPDIE